MSGGCLDVGATDCAPNFSVVGAGGVGKVPRVLSSTCRSCDTTSHLLEKKWKAQATTHGCEASARTHVLPKHTRPGSVTVKTDKDKRAPSSKLALTPHPKGNESKL
eukprot:4303553-Amphidinium_carterae.1